MPRRNFALAWCLEGLPCTAQVELESRLTGPRVNPAERTLATGTPFLISQFWEMLGGFIK